MNYKELKEELKKYMNEEYLSLIDKYYEESEKIHEGMKRNTGEDYIYHSIEVAYILAQLKMDPITVGCALIHEAISLNKRTYEELKETFDEETAVIVNCITKISNLRRTFKKENNKEKYRRIIVGLADNPKALFIKFADRLHNMRTLYVHDKDHQQDMIDETQNIYIPIAHRLGMKSVMSELEDLCLRYSYPDEYESILSRLNASSAELENCLELMKDEISEILTEHNIKFKIVSRVKSVRGIYNKLHIGKKWENIYDLLGIRVLVDKVEECYLVIGYIHSKFVPIPKRFKDFIANPKSNMYQSIHTTVFGIEGKIYEVQVRTYEMDEIAERGVASHWSYKEKTDGKVKNDLETRLEQFRALIEVNDMGSNVEFFNNFNKELKKKEMYVFTPKGDVIELPIKATPIDFAYKIHSEVGNTTVSALVNGKIVKLNYELEDGDIVNLNTQVGKGPSKNWLSFVKTENAKGRIKSYFYKKEREKLITVGREMLEMEAKKRKENLNDLLASDNISKVLKDFKVDNIEDLYSSVATLRFLPTSILSRIDGSNEKVDILSKSFDTFNKTNSENTVIVAGSSDIMTSIASCCNPVFGEDIVGYVTKGYGVKIHSKHCKNIDLKSERIIEVSWNEKISSRYSVNVNIYMDTSHEDISGIVTSAIKFDIIVEAMNLIRKRKNENYYSLTLKVKNFVSLNKFIDEIKNISYVNVVERTGKQ